MLLEQDWLDEATAALLREALTRIDGRSREVDIGHDGH
jgi:hypothetical protein